MSLTNSAKCLRILEKLTPLKCSVWFRTVTSTVERSSMKRGRESTETAGDMAGQNPRQNDGKLLQKVVNMVLEEKLVTGIDEKTKVVEFKHPKDLLATLDLDISKKGKSMNDTIKIMEKVMKHSVKTQHPYFYNQLYAGIDEVALAASWLSSSLNTNQHTFEVAPAFIMVEHYVISLLIKIFGWEDGDGIFSPGGSMSNMYGMQLARYRKHPAIKTDGVFGRKPFISFTSDQSHYSIDKAANWMGLGMNSVVAVKSDNCGRMIPEALREAIHKAIELGGEPFFVNATAGTTVLGSFDPLDKLADVCQEENLWLHVDACWGGSVIFSKAHKSNLEGINRVDSIAWNAHKMIGAPLQCSPFIVKHKDLLQECNSAKATYLFQQDKFYDVSFDTGDKSFQCGRKVDAFKLYLLLSTHGLDEIGKRVDDSFSASKYLHEQVLARPGFKPVLEEPQCTNVCFWYIPPSLRDQPETPEWWEKISKVAPQVKARMVENGAMMIGYQPIANKNFVNFFRMVNCCYPTPSNPHMDHILETIEKYGTNLEL